MRPYLCHEARQEHEYDCNRLISALDVTSNSAVLFCTPRLDPSATCVHLMPGGRCTSAVEVFRNSELTTLNRPLLADAERQLFELLRKALLPWLDTFLN